MFTLQKQHTVYWYAMSANDNIYYIDREGQRDKVTERGRDTKTGRVSIWLPFVAKQLS